MFIGQQREGFSRIGAYFYKGRFYATGLGHFLSADSSTADGLDRYAYVRFNPLRYNDPTGHHDRKITLTRGGGGCPGSNACTCGRSRTGTGRCETRDARALRHRLLAA